MCPTPYPDAPTRGGGPGFKELVPTRKELREAVSLALPVVAVHVGMVAMGLGTTLP